MNKKKQTDKGQNNRPRPRHKNKQMKKKQILFFAAAGLLLATGSMMTSCKKEVKTTEAPVGKNKSTARTPGEKHEYVIDGVNLHRPKHGCKRGFWFCIEGHWEHTLNGNPVNWIPTNSGDIRIWSEICNNNQQMIIHYPLSLLNNPDFTADDLSKLSADNDYEIANGITIKSGEYPVNINATDLTVLVDLL